MYTCQCVLISVCIEVRVGKVVGRIRPLSCHTEDFQMSFWTMGLCRLQSRGFLTQWACEETHQPRSPPSGLGAHTVRKRSLCSLGGEVRLRPGEAWLGAARTFTLLAAGDASSGVGRQTGGCG